jgi:hypothetical protein
MINNYGYLLHEAERTRTRAEQHQADVLVGQIAAAVVKPAKSLAKLWTAAAAAARFLGRTASVGGPAARALRAHR